MTVRRISAENVEKIFVRGKDRLSALGPISLEIQPGEFVCILGESGCGKSTLWRIFAGLEKPSAGCVYMDGEPISGPCSRRGVVFQSPALLPWLNVEENVSLGFKIRGEKIDKDHIHKTIKLVGLGGFEKAKPASLSGGMAQRAAIARALVNRPDVLLMDEPFAALDALTRLRMQDALLNIWEQERLTLVFITHDIDEAIALGSKIVVMTSRPGKISREFAVPLERPRLRGSSEFLHLKGIIADQLIAGFHGEKSDPSK